MAKFDGILICSDLDGTFWGQGAEVENEKAIKYFTQNGGRFSFATGRTVDFIREKPFFPIINAPTCLFNGAVVYDYATETLLREVRLKYTVREFLKAVSGRAGEMQKLVLYRDIHDGGTMYTDLKTIPEQDMECHSLKLLCVFETPESALEFKAYCQQLEFFSESYISRSWTLGVEFNACDGTKGHALDFIKDQLGAIHTSVGIGDYENDLPLVSHADIGAAVGNGVECVKLEADWVVRSCSEFAVKDLIERLEDRFCKEK